MNGWSWWDEARAAAAREFGARHYKAFAMAAYARRLGPAVALLVLAAGVAGAIWAGVHWWPTWSPYLPYVVAAALGLGVLAGTTAIVTRRRRWM